MSETGVTGANKAKVYKLKMEGNKRAGKVIKLLNQKDRLITTILLGNNAVNICASALATSFFIGIYGHSAETIFYVTIVMTALVLIFAEILPKVYALKNSEKVALFTSPIIYFLLKLFFPLIYIAEKIVGFFMQLFRLEKDGLQGLANSVDIIRGAIEYHHEEGNVHKDDKDMLGSILDLEHTDVADIMQHRKDIETIDISLSPQEVINKLLNSQYSRIPVFSGTPENITGILYTKTVMRALMQDAKGNPDNLDINQLLVEPWFVPESTTLKEQLVAFKEKHQHFALVVDEYGSLEGLITLEDILEEIVGNIEDEYDIEYHLIQDNFDGSYIIDGAMPLRDLNRQMAWDLPLEGATTIAGLIIQESQTIPSKGQIFNFYGFRFEILRRKGNQISKVKITRDEQQEEE